MNCETCLHYELCKNNNIPIFGMSNIVCQYEEHTLIGEWIISMSSTRCSKCGYNGKTVETTNFCPNCGSDNRKKEGDQK